MDEWTAIVVDGVVNLQRRVDCVICCKRKRHACAVCEGTGVRRVLHPLDAAAADALVASLAVAVEATRSG